MSIASEASKVAVDRKPVEPPKNEAPKKLAAPEKEEAAPVKEREIPGKGEKIKKEA